METPPFPCFLIYLTKQAQSFWTQHTTDSFTNTQKTASRCSHFTKLQTMKNRFAEFRNTYRYPNGQYLSQIMGLHFLGRGRHWQISQLWASVRKPKGQSKLQARLRPVHSSSPVKTHGQHVSSKDEQSRTHRSFNTFPSSSNLPQIPISALL